jgi:3-methyladenine DNA glycosylase/8-oxoguanine DNA glycosylase
MPSAHRIDVTLPIDLPRSLRPLVASGQDPTIRLRADRFVRCFHSLDGPATIAIERLDGHRFEARAWGPGRERALAGAGRLLGTDDRLDGFDPGRHRAVARAAHRRPGLRIIATGHVADVLVPTILAQRVTSLEAARSWTKLVRRHGAPAPGPFDLRLPPSPEQIAALPSWAWHEIGVERSRAQRAAQACRYLPHVQASVGLDHQAAMTRLQAVPGIGVWTAAHVRRMSAGDPDAVEVGDYSVKDHIAWNLAGEARATDDRMLELLEPFAGHRGRVVRLLLSVGQRPPAFGARQRIVEVQDL